MKKKISKYKNYICLNALHGPFGEDGKIQKILKKNNIKFTHSGITSSKNCFDKIITKKIISKKNILTAKYKLLKKKEFNFEELSILKKKYKKFVIKPNRSGSSYGIKLIKTNKDFTDFIREIETYKNKILMHDEILVEEFISGKELTVSTINFSKKINALAVTEIKSKNSFFDYQAKYSSGYSKHILPANLSKKIYEQCLKIAIKTHKLMGCNSIARTDFIYNQKKNKIYFLEINTQPGLTPISLLPEQAKYKKISFDKIILGILKKTN